MQIDVVAKFAEIVDAAATNEGTTADRLAALTNDLVNATKKQEARVGELTNLEIKERTAAIEVSTAPM